VKEVFDYIDSSKNSTIELLSKLVRQPSVAATGQGIKECSELVTNLMGEIGANPKVYDLGEGSPVVTGEIKSKKNPKMTILFYNHYDVQPPEPLELWDSPPFTPSVKDGTMYGRGVSDDKGELAGRIKLTEAFLRTWNDIPCNFKFVFEGEEEIGSIHLGQYVKKYPEIFRADGVIWEFGGVDPKGRPQVILGVKGILYVELTSKIAKKDAHSSLGAIVENPAWRLVGALSTLKKHDRILIPGWYKDVKRFSKEELEWIRKAPYDAKSVKEELGIRSFITDMGVDEAKKALAGKPTCTICGINSGYTGVGSKTVLPSEALAKVDFRLVPDQDPNDLIKKLRKHMVSQGYGDVKITYSEGEKAKRTSPSEPLVMAAKEAAEAIYEKPAIVEISSAGTGPMYLFHSPCVAIGGGHAFSNAHAPNENKKLDYLVYGMKWVADTVNRFAM
jgi:acetylornithine deacetylase/succinyl-diaminopimelate desuccinylase-like protein